MRILTRRGQPYEYHDTETGRDLFSVSQIRKVLHDPYCGLDPSVLDAALVRGTVLHLRFFYAMAHATDRSACDYPKRIEAYGGYCDSMDRWIDEVRPKVYQGRLEQKGLNLDRGYAGQVDCQCYLERHRHDGLAIGDCKTGQFNPTDLIQVVAYDQMEGWKSKHQFLVYFDSEGGNAKEVWIEPGAKGVHWSAFLGGMSALRWRMRFAK